MKKLLSLLSILSALVWLTGCPSQQAWLASRPPLYADGFKDGCRSAERYWQNNLADYEVIDPAKKEEPQYKEGWEYGYNKCYAEKETEIWMTRGRF